ncbi:MAG: hypothetical protein HY537_09800 [Deltaproteobacteria bacterium]|nr:hypothetical protein [Deltaproteobacteria bacterium]
MDKISLLITESDLYFRSVLCSTLEKGQFSVVFCDKLSNLSAELKKQTFDILIVGHHGAGSAAVEWLANIRNEAGPRHLNVIVTSFREQGDAECRKGSAEGIVHLKYPFLPSELIRIIENFFND